MGHAQSVELAYVKMIPIPSDTVSQWIVLTIHLHILTISREVRSSSPQEIKTFDLKNQPVIQGSQLEINTFNLGPGWAWVENRGLLDMFSTHLQ